MPWQTSKQDVNYLPKPLQKLG